jgi:hypothetical protein
VYLYARNVILPWVLNVQYSHLKLSMNMTHILSHSLTLSKTIMKNVIVLICKEKRNPNHQFYYCEKCNFVTHPRCIVGRHPYIKYGRDFNWKVHQHPLNFVQRTKDSHPCDSCGEVFDEDVAINCTQCKFIVHLRTQCMDKLRIK